MDANAREIGSACGIWCLDAKNLNMMMKSLNVNEKPDVEIETKIYNERNNLLKEQKEDFPSQTTYLRYDYWTLPDYRNIMNLIPLMKQMKDKLDEAKKSHTILVHQLLTAFALSSLGLTGSLIKKNIDDFPNGLLTALTGGSRERRDREALFDMIGKMLPEKELSFVPDFFNNYAELVNRYKNITLYSHRIASCLTDITRNLLVSDVKEIEGHIEDQYNEKTIKLSRDTMYFAIKNMNISENVFSHFLKVG
jgi:hypothetical protein